jgi:hypothetical protein
MEAGRGPRNLRMRLVERDWNGRELPGKSGGTRRKRDGMLFDLCERDI